LLLQHLPPPLAARRHAGILNPSRSGCLSAPQCRTAAADAYQRWRSGSGEGGKPHRMALMRAEGGEKGSSGNIREFDVKKMKVSAGN